MALQHKCTSCSSLSSLNFSEDTFSPRSDLSHGRSSAPCSIPSFSSTSRGIRIDCGLKDLRHRITTVESTKKITDAMKLVAAARVRKAQEAVVNSRPFSENLIKVLLHVSSCIQSEDIDHMPLAHVRPVQRVAIVIITSDQGLCGSFNNQVLKKTEDRIFELSQIGVDYTLFCLGRKGAAYFKKRPHVSLSRVMDIGNIPTTKQAQVIADELFSLFISEQVDKVEFIYAKFVSLIKSEPVIHTLLPISSQGVVCVKGNCVDAADDEMFRVTTKKGKLSIEREHMQQIETPHFASLLLFEQEPVQILDALFPLYLNSQILRALQESVASEVAARMTAMKSASDNASELKKTLSVTYNRERQAKITGELIEIVAGANVL